jgi:hypothetical protein
LTGGERPGKSTVLTNRIDFVRWRTYLAAQPLAQFVHSFGHEGTFLLVTKSTREGSRPYIFRVLAQGILFKFHLGMFIHESSSLNSICCFDCTMVWIDDGRFIIFKDFPVAISTCWGACGDALPGLWANGAIKCLVQHILFTACNSIRQ